MTEPVPVDFSQKLKDAFTRLNSNDANIDDDVDAIQLAITGMVTTAAMNTALAAKQDAATAATDTELATGLAPKQDAATAATDTELASGLAGKLDIGTGTQNSTTYRRGDGTWAIPPSVVEVATVSALTSLSSPVDGLLYYLQGYYAARDGGQGFVRYVAGSTTTANGGTVFTHASGRFFRTDVNGVATVLQFGARGDGVTNDAAAINAATAAMAAVNGTVVFPAKATKYLYTEPLTLLDGVTWEGTGTGYHQHNRGSMLRRGANVVGITAIGSSVNVPGGANARATSHVRNIRLEGDDAFTEDHMRLTGTTMCNFEDVIWHTAGGRHILARELMDSRFNGNCVISGGGSYDGTLPAVEFISGGTIPVGAPGYDAAFPTRTYEYTNEVTWVAPRFEGYRGVALKISGSGTNKIRFLSTKFESTISQLCPVSISDTKNFIAHNVFIYAANNKLVSSVDVATDTLTTAAAHNYLSGTRVRLTGAVGSLTGITPSTTTYWIVNPSGTTYQLSSTDPATATTIVDLGGSYTANALTAKVVFPCLLRLNVCQGGDISVTPNTASYVDTFVIVENFSTGTRVWASPVIGTEASVLFDHLVQIDNASFYRGCRVEGAYEVFQNFMLTTTAQATADASKRPSNRPLHFHGDGVPLGGPRLRGDAVWALSPSASASPGWVCVTAGKPGTWRAMANLVA